MALACAALVGAGCGGDGDSNRPANPPSAADQVRPPPAGLRYRTPPNPDLDQQFRTRLRSDLGADDVATRSVYRGKKFVAGVVVAHSFDRRSPAEIARRTFAGPARVTPTTVGGKPAHLARATASDGELAVIDTFDRYMLIVIAGDERTVRTVAAPMVR